MLIKKIINKLYKQYEEKTAERERVKKIKKSLSKLKRKETLTKEQVNEIQTFYEGILGYKIPLEWHQYFYSRTGVYSKLYVPSSEYKNHIIGRLNLYPFHLAYNDKNMTDVTLPNTRQPKIWLKNMGGYFYSEGTPITREQALDLCKNLGDVIIKPSMAGRGRGVKKININNGLTDFEGKTTSDLFDYYYADYLIQEVIHQHPDMSALNPSSINTCRIVTYRKGLDIKVVYTVIRIGRSGMNIDNESAGGISAKINNDGTLAKYAYGAPGVDKVEYTDSGIKLDGYKVPSYKKALELVKKSHLQLPYFNMIGWDIAIEADGNPIMIELNLNPDLSQSANGPAFGDYTEEILKDAMQRYNSWTPQTTRCMIKKNYHIHK